MLPMLQARGLIHSLPLASGIPVLVWCSSAGHSFAVSLLVLLDLSLEVTHQLFFLYTYSLGELIDRLCLPMTSPFISLGLSPVEDSYTQL